MDSESIQFLSGMAMGAVCVLVGYIQGRRHGRLIARDELEHRRLINRR